VRRAFAMIASRETYVAGMSLCSLKRLRLETYRRAKIGDSDKHKLIASNVARLALFMADATHISIETPSRLNMTNGRRGPCMAT
jgi:hypothetical protein